MRKRSRVIPVLGALFLAPSLGAAATIVSKLELKPVPAGVGRLFPESAQMIRVVVQDQRPPDPFVVSGVGDAGFGRRVLQGFYTQHPRVVPELFEAGAREAVEILGMKSGEGAVLELSILEFRVELAPPAFGLPNFIAYGRVEAVLKSPEGEELARATHPAASWETASQWEAVAAAYTKAAWEASARTLLSRFPGQPDPDAIRRLLASLDTNKNQRQRDYAIFWLGLVGREAPEVAEKLFAVFRKEPEQSVRQSAALALAMHAAPGARAEFEALLSGAQKLPQWDARDDAEEAWHLLRGLALLGVTDLAPMVPPIKRHRDKLQDLLRFQDTGEIPRMDPKDMAELTRKLEKKRKA